MEEEINEIEENKSSLSDNVNSKSEGKKVLKNIIMVAISNICSLLSGVLVGFVIPKLMGVSDYGYYKTFTLYLGYVGLFHLGFVDGIYLVYGGKNYDSLDKKSFRTFSKFLFLFQLIISAIITIIALCFISYEYGFIFLFIGINLIVTNLTYYYQDVSQITGRFKELSIVNVVKSFMTIVSVLILFILYKVEYINILQYRVYLIVYSVINLLVTIFYIFKYRDITFGKSNSFKEEKSNIILFFKVGIPLLVANLVLVLILNLDRQFVSILYDTETYGVYAFAYNMLSLITTVIGAISTVLYPTIKSYSEDRLKKDYNMLIGIISIFVAFCLLCYQPLQFIIEHWLPNYVDSIPVFRAILPGLILSSCVTMIMYNYYKNLGKQFSFFVKGIIILVFSIGANFLAYFIFKTAISLSYASVITTLLWYFMTDITFIRRWKNNPLRNILYVGLIMASFYLITYFISNIYLSFALYLAAFIILTLALYHKVLFDLIRRRH